MKSKMVVISAVLCLSMISTSVIYGADAVSDTTNKDTATEVTAKEENKVIDLSIEDAVKYAKENSHKMWQIDDGIEQLKNERANMRQLKNSIELAMDLPLGIQPDAFINDYVKNMLVEEGYYIKQMDQNIAVFERNKNQLNLGLEIGAKSVYYGALAKEKTIETNEKNLVQSKEQLKVINLKFDNGSATKAEVLNCEMAVQKAQTEVDSSKDDYEIAKLDLLKTIGLPLKTKINLTDKALVYVPTKDISLENALKLASENRPEILDAKNNLELQEVETDIYTSYYTKPMREYKASVKKLEDAKLNIEETNEAVELDVRKSYLELVKAERSLKNMDKTLELATESARISKLLYENGMASAMDVLQAETALSQAEIGRYQLLVMYNINKMAFDNCDKIATLSAK